MPAKKTAKKSTKQKPAPAAQARRPAGPKGPAAGATITLRELNRATAARQLLLERADVDVVSAIERVGPLQAQEPRPPFLALWSRLRGFTREKLRAALTEKRVVRATMMRVTLHLLSARDYLAWRPALHTMLAAGAVGALRDRMKGLDVAATLTRARAFLTSGAGGGGADFDAIRTHLLSHFPNVNDRALGYIVRTHLPLVQVPTGDAWGFDTGGTFALCDRWLGKDCAVDVDDAAAAAAGMRAMILRYLAAFGPASVADFQTWSAVKNAAPAFAELRPQLRSFVDDRGRELFDVADAPRPPADAEVPVRLLPEFDSLVLAHDDRRRVIADEHRAGLTTKNLRVRATVLVDGFVAGFWRIERKGKSAKLTLEPFATLPKKTQQALQQEAEQLLQLAEPDARDHDVGVG